MSQETLFFVTNQYLNERFPLAACPEGSFDKKPYCDWYIRDLSSRFLAALYLNDVETMRQLQERLVIHRACRESRI